jgi:type I restriction enzyme, R subunit
VAAAIRRGRELLAFKSTLTAEEARGLSEGLADELLSTLKRGKLVLDWRKQQATRAAVRVAVEETLDQLPGTFTRKIFAEKCDAVYQHVFDSYWDDGQSVYAMAA